MSIYFGGGTPSLWRSDCLARGGRTQSATRFGGTPREVTLEANPTDCTAEQPRRVARGRHRPDLDRRAVARAGRARACSAAIIGSAMARRRSRACSQPGIAASCDFILGTPTDRAYDTSWIDAIAATTVGHLSIYELTIEDRTAFGQRVKIRPPGAARRRHARRALHRDARRARARAASSTTRSARTRVPASARSTTRCTGAARRSSGSASVRHRSSSPPMAPASARPTRAAPPTTSRRRARPPRSCHRPPARCESIARGWACARCDGVAEADLPPRRS